MSNTAGSPTGPVVFVPGLGEEVGTFTNKRADLVVNDATGGNWLMHHVPMKKRGMYRVKDLPEGVDAEDLRTDDRHYILCGGVTSTTVKGHRKAGDPCAARALNRSGYCGRHGGQLHPLDKIVNDASSPALQRTQDPSTMTRWQKLCAGIITVDDLDDEELLKGRTRDEKTGLFVGPAPKNIPKALHDRMVKDLFSRSDQKLKENLLAAVDTIAEIAKGTAYEPQDRFKAAAWIFERLRGKNPEVVVHQQDKPWEHIFSNIQGGSRAESRLARGTATEGDIAVLEGAVDAEFIEMIEGDVQAIQEEDDWSNKPGEPAAYLNYVQPVEDPTQLHEVLPAQRLIQEETPPQGPEARETYERTLAEEARLAEDPAAARKALRERLKAAKGRRYAARERGATTITVTPFETRTKEIMQPSTTDPREWRTTFHEPKAPAAYGKRSSDWE